MSSSTRRLAALASIVLLASSGAVAADAGAPSPVMEGLRRIIELEPYLVDFEDETWARAKRPNPLRVVREAAEGTVDLARIRSALSSGYGVPDEAASEWLTALALSHVADLDRESFPYEQQAQDAFTRAARASRGEPAVLLTFGAFLSSLEGGLDPRFLEAFDFSETPTAASIEVIRSAAYALGAYRLALAERAVSRDPQSLQAVLDALGLDYGSEATPFYLSALRHQLRAGSQTHQASPLAERLLRDLLEDERPLLALRVLDELPTELRADLLSDRSRLRASSFRVGASGSREVPYPAEDLRVAVAGALIAAGRSEEAPSFATKLPRREAPARVQALRHRACGYPLKLRLLELGLKPSATGRFDLVVDLKTCREVRGMLWGLVGARAIGGQYPAVARAGLEWHRRQLAEREQDSPSPQGDFEFVKAAKAELAADTRATLALIDAELAKLPATPRPAPSADAVSLRLRELIAATPATVFEERPALPAPRQTVVPGTVTWKSGDLGDGRKVVRAERFGEHVLMVAVSQDFDPTGEVSSGGYWLAESVDGGKRYTRLSYLGLRHFRPYVLAGTESTVPLLDGPTLQLEASVREIDESSIRFPPIALRTRREGPKVVLRVPLAEVHRDSDADGLTDLAEQRLLTDPSASDTDGDGIGDRTDALPLVPTQKTRRTPASQLVTAFFDWFLEPSAPGEKGPPSAAGIISAGPEQVLFVEGDRGLFAGVEAAQRIVILSPEEIEQATKKFGAFYPMRLEFFFNAKGDEAFLEWHEHWRGGSLRARKKNGRWSFTVVGSWIT